MGQSVIIENRGGAGGMVGAAAVAQAPPDGYTFLFGTGSTHGTNPSLYSRISYDPVKDFVPVVLVSSSPLLLVVPTPFPAKSVNDLIALARSRPGALGFASYGTGSINHLGAELFNSMADIAANHIPYRGSAPALTDLIAGRIDYMFDGVSTSLGYIQAQTIRALGVAGPRRTPVLPDVPTVAESALAGFDTTVWFGLFAPAGTAKPIAELVNSKVNAILASPEIKANFDNRDRAGPAEARRCLQTGCRLKCRNGRPSCAPRIFIWIRNRGGRPHVESQAPNASRGLRPR